MISFPTDEELTTKATVLLAKNGLTVSDVDAVMLGYSGDVNSDSWYGEFTTRLFQNTATITFKNLFGESPSASAFACWYAAHLLSGKQAHGISVRSPLKTALGTVLIYNHYQGKQHGFVLMRSA
jgi:hypothetical protein